MKHFFKIFFGSAVVSLALVGFAHAQSTNPNYWKTNVPSSTISPINGNLQVPCANVAGLCNGGTINNVQYVNPGYATVGCATG
jgi:hypothetical protein